MDFDFSPASKALIARLRAFYDEHISPNEATYAKQNSGSGADRWKPIQIIEDLKPKARARRRAPAAARAMSERTTLKASRHTAISLSIIRAHFVARISIPSSALIERKSTSICQRRQ